MRCYCIRYILFFFISSLLSAESQRTWKIKDTFLAHSVRDAVSIHQEIFNWDTVKIISTIFPAYLLTRMFDDEIQNCFYHGHCQNLCHKNKNQAPKWCAELAQYSIVPPIVVMFGSTFVGKTKKLRTTSWIFLLGMPFVIFGKDVFKKLRFEAARRPWCEKYNSHERSFGGFPSGHMAESSYMTVLYGLRYGPRAAGPLAVASTFLGVTFLNCNRHYVSQLVAGVGIGTIFAVAANKVIDKKLSDPENSMFDIGMELDAYGGPALKVGWRF